MEHIVRQNKAILKGMYVNKTYKAVERSSKAAFGVRNIISQFDTETEIHPVSSSHTHACTTDDVKEMVGIVHKQKPFVLHPGRQLHSFKNISKTPLDKLNVSLLHSWLTRHKRNLFRGLIYEEEEQDEDNEEDDEDGNFYFSDDNDLL